MKTTQTLALKRYNDLGEGWLRYPKQLLQSKVSDRSILSDGETWNMEKMVFEVFREMVLHFISILSVKIKKNY